MMYPALFLH